MYSILKPHWIFFLLPFLSACDVMVASPNNPLSLSNQLFSTPSFSNKIGGTIVYATGDSSIASLRIITGPRYGKARIVSQFDGTFEYELTSLEGLQGDSFIVELNSGGSSASAVMSIVFSDDSSPIVSMKPLEGANQVNISTDLWIESETPLLSSTLSVQSSNGACSGTIQLSSDNFASCVGLSDLTSTRLARTFKVTPIVNLERNTVYKLKVTREITSYFELPIAETIQSFTTYQSGLVINEIGSSYYSNTLRWFELFNGTASTLNLSDFELKSFTINSDTQLTSQGSFTFPATNIAPNQYLIVRAQSWTKDYTDTDSIIYLKSGNEYPYWSAQGYLELIEKVTGDTVDFVAFGGSYLPSGNGASWLGAEATLVSNADSFGQSIGRDANQSDSNSAADWTHYNPGTFGSVNDVECAIDDDNDMVPDCNEAENKTYAGMPLYEWGARSGITDIFIEVDYMDTTDEGVIPRKEALDMVVAAFANKNINIHFDVGDLFDQSPGLNPSMYDLGGGNQVPFSNGITFNSENLLIADFHDYKDAYFNSDRLQFFHYMIMANSQKEDGSSGSSGLAELFANDIIITLGGWGLNATADLNKLINYQASTIMHELGHNLGLYHGGHESVNDKPNYHSVMNYTYQLGGLSEIGNNEGDRMHQALGNACSGVLVNGPSDSYLNFQIGYSDGSSIGLNETSLNETLGLGRLGSAPVDFNCNGNNTESAVVTDVNQDGSTDTLTDHDDWSNLVTDFGGIASQSNHGTRDFQAPIAEFIAWPAKIIHDRSSNYIKETLTKPKDQVLNEKN
ncbi:hypothetical protein [Reinekea sp.]|jgi:hypothetical protein|uniref:hypothetical protein n=1 Tax=Reinekea sp. TaxID=1970455 RepID=UPI00398A0D0D